MTLRLMTPREIEKDFTEALMDFVFQLLDAEEWHQDCLDFTATKKTKKCERAIASELDNWLDATQALVSKISEYQCTDLREKHHQHQLKTGKISYSLTPILHVESGE
jgi:hypothetical protein